MQASIRAVYYSHSDSPHSRKIQKYAWILAVAWSTLVLASSVWDNATHRDTLQIVDYVHAGMRQPLVDVAESQTARRLAADGVIWFVGLSIIGIGASELSRSAREQKRAEAELYEQALQLEEEIAERQKTQESLLASEAKLRHTQKMDVIGQLAGGVAHDFNNMLTTIIGSAEMMESYVGHDPGAMKMLRRIRNAATRSAELTQQLLAFSRKEQKYSTQVRIGAIISAVIPLLEHAIDNKINIGTRFAAHNDIVIGDETFLRNTLLNLAFNARDAMPGGGTVTFATANVALDVHDCASHVLTVQPGNFLEISVSDTGFGMSQEMVERIFEPFFTTKTVGRGTGLGLSAVYSTVKEHHGSIHVSSEIGRGTVFKVYLPSYTSEMAVRAATGGGRGDQP